MVLVVVSTGKSTKTRGAHLCLSMLHITDKIDYFWQHH